MHASAKMLDLGQPAEQWPALGLGTWRFGESARTADQEVSVIRRAVQIGYRLFDTAEMYGEGGAERVLGQALTQALREPGIRREQFRVVSKAYPHHGDVAALRRACDASRRRLQLDTIDLYLLHWRGDIPLAETVRGFEQLLQAAVHSPLGRQQLRRRVISTKCFDCPARPACAANQVYYSLSERGAEFDLLPRMLQQGMPLMAYCPIDGGRIAQHARLGRLAGLAEPPRRAACVGLAASPTRHHRDSESGPRSAPAGKLAKPSRRDSRRGLANSGCAVSQAHPQAEPGDALAARRPVRRGQSSSLTLNCPISCCCTARRHRPRSATARSCSGPARWSSRSAAIDSRPAQTTAPAPAMIIAPIAPLARAADLAALGRQVAGDVAHRARRAR